MKKMVWVLVVLASLYAASDTFTPPVSDLRTEPGVDSQSNLAVSIPKDWRLAGVSSSGIRDTDLWFQDSQGNVYMMSGYALPANPIQMAGAVRFQFRKGIGRIPVTGSPR
jgi:hypothetical protein